MLLYFDVTSAFVIQKKISIVSIQTSIKILRRKGIENAGDGFYRKRFKRKEVGMEKEYEVKKRS